MKTAFVFSIAVLALGYAAAQSERCGFNPFEPRCVCRDSCGPLEYEDLDFLTCASSCCCPSDEAPTCGIPILEDCVCREQAGCEDFEYENPIFGCDSGTSSCCCLDDDGSGQEPRKTRQ